MCFFDDIFAVFFLESTLYDSDQDRLNLEKHSSFDTHPESQQNQNQPSPRVMTIVVQKSHDLTDSDTNMDSNSNKKFNKNLNFNRFRPIFIELYEQYIEANRAPYEVNINGFLRDTMRRHYVNIVNDMDIDVKTFAKMWNDLGNICDELLETIFGSMTHCPSLFDQL